MCVCVCVRVYDVYVYFNVVMGNPCKIYCNSYALNAKAYKLANNYANGAEDIKEL